MSFNSKHMEKSLGVRSLVMLCMMLSLVLVMVTVLPLEVVTSFREIWKLSDIQSFSLRTPEWKAVMEDREYEKVHNSSYQQPQRFVPMGTATFLFVHFSTHRVEPNSFAVVGLGAKALYLYNEPRFFCTWYPHNHNAVRDGTIHCNGSFIQPAQKHVSYGKEYVGTVVYCTFDQPVVGGDGVGGHLLVTATSGRNYTSGLRDDVNFVARVEAPGEFNISHFLPPYRLDHVYCGGPLHGSLNAQRVREWIAYHAQFLGNRSHFFMYDVGGIDREVQEVIRPWVTKGQMTIVNVREGKNYNSHYHNQYVLLNDCLFRSRTMAPWTWFFDVDEYIYIPPEYSNVNQVIDELETNFWGKRLQRISMLQNPMDHKHCIRHEDSTKQKSAWAIEKMVYKRIQMIELGRAMDRKSVVRADSALAVGPHEPVIMKMPPGASGVPEVTTWEQKKLQYYHFRGTVNKRDSDVCQELLERHVNSTKFDDVQHQFDGSMMVLAEQTKRFEQETISSSSMV